ncbi:MAG TPA: retropepsin-like aspartic protease [Flavobacteriales bacterium]|nr:retropepsin-like aspartic protease [Flavobacteriales bacterium]HPH82845.1 retropepsin-like aspartic protease [Flavobacteriales bacterium]
MNIALPIEIVDLRDDGMHLFITAKAGRKNCRLLLDTGASRTVFDSTQFQKLLPNAKLVDLESLSTGLGTDSLPGKVSSIAHFKLGDFKVIDFPVIVLDLNHVNRSYESLGFKSIHGVLGSDILFKFKAEIDYGKLELRLHVN